MKLSLKERKLVLEYAKKLLKNRLTEAFKSNLMRDLNKYTVPIGGRYSHVNDNQSITQYLKGLSINASELTDNDIHFYPKNSNPKSLMQMYPNSTLIFVRPEDKLVVGIVHKGKHVRMGTQSPKYVPKYNTTSQDPKGIRNSRDKYRSVHVGQTGSSKSDKTGLSSIYSITLNDLYQYPHYLIFNTKLQNYSSFKTDVFQPLKALIRNKKHEYENKIQQMRAAVRTGEFPKDIVDSADLLLSLGDKILEFSKNVINNPSKYVTTTKISRYGDGRIYGASSLLDLYKNAADRITWAETSYRSGKDYKRDIKSAMEYLNDIKSIIRV